jgi:hypothetical protein
MTHRARQTQSIAQAWLIGTCVLFASNQSSADGHTITVSGREDGAFLGVGYDSKTETFGFKCVEWRPGEEIYVGAGFASGKLEKLTSEAGSLDALGFSTNARVQYGLIKGSLTAEFAKQTVSSSYSMTTTFQESIRYKNSELNNRHLTPEAASLLRGKTVITEDFRSACGDEFVEQVQLGARLFISFKVEFTSAEERQRFAASVTLEGPIGALNAKLEKVSNQFRKTAVVSISAYQVGGRYSRLGAVFDVKDPDVVHSEAKASGSSEMYSFVTCSMERLDACKRVLSRAIQYAVDQKDPEAFSQQIDVTAVKPGAITGLAELGYITKPWIGAGGLKGTPAILDAAIVLRRRQLSNRFSRWANAVTRLEGLKARPFRMTDAQLALITKYLQIANGIVTDIAETAERCYSEERSCIKGVDDLDKRIDTAQAVSRYDERNLNFAPQTFGQWCDLVGGDPDLPAVYVPALQETRDMVDAMIAFARKRMINNRDAAYWQNAPDKCGFIEGILMLLDEIGFDSADFTDIGRSARDLRPLGSLSNLTSLTLRGAGVRSLRGIERLVNLRRLDLSDNSIEDISPLLNFSRLQTIDLSHNHIVDASRLARLPSLTVLNLGSNPSLKGCPVMTAQAICLL